MGFESVVYFAREQDAVTTLERLRSCAYVVHDQQDAVWLRDEQNHGVWTYDVRVFLHPGNSLLIEVSLTSHALLQAAEQALQDSEYSVTPLGDDDTISLAEAFRL